MEETKYMKNFIKRYFSYKLLFVYFVYAFLLITAIFTRSFLGISLFGFRIGELIIGFALILTLYFFFFPKPSVYFDFGSRKFFFVHKVIVLYVLLRLILNFENIDLYQFKSSSFIWTISIIYFGIFVSSLYRQNILTILGFSLAPIFVYIFQTGNYPNLLINIFQNYSDKFQFMKAADMVIITIVSSLYLKQSQNNKILSVIYTNFLCFLFLPLLAINSRGAVLGLILFLVIENLNNFSLYKRQKSVIVILLFISAVTFSFSSLRVSNIGSDGIINSEEPLLYGLTEVVSDIANEKKTQEVFLSFYFSNGRINSTDPTTNWRLDIWQDVGEDLSKKGRILYGYGYGEIIPVMKDPSAPGRLGRDGLNENVHNYFVTTLARGGLINLVLFLFLHFEIFKNLKKTKLSKSTYSLIVPCLFMSSLDITMDGVQFPLLYYFFVGYFSQEQH